MTLTFDQRDAGAHRVLDGRNGPGLIARVRFDDLEIGTRWASCWPRNSTRRATSSCWRARLGPSVAMMRAEGVKKAIARYPNMKILSEQYGEMTRAEGMRIMEDLLQAHGSAINGVYAISARATGPPGPWRLSSGATWWWAPWTLDFSKDLEQAIHDGLIGGKVRQQTITMGRLGVQIARDVVGGSGPSFP